MTARDKLYHQILLECHDELKEDLIEGLLHEFLRILIDDKDICTEENVIEALACFIPAETKGQVRAIKLLRQAAEHLRKSGTHNPTGIDGRLRSKGG